MNSEEKPSLLFILTGLGRYSLYKLPFLKRHTFCAGLPRVLMSRIQRALRYASGSCKHVGANGERIHCRWISFLGLYIGACNDAVKRIKKSRLPAE
jgi:hypothetical protein